VELAAMIGALIGPIKTLSCVVSVTKPVPVIVTNVPELPLRGLTEVTVTVTPILFFLLQLCKMNKQSNRQEMPAAMAKDFFITCDYAFIKGGDSVKIVDR